MAPKEQITNVGKRVGGALYLHRSAIDFLENKDRELFLKASKLVEKGHLWNVVRIQPDNVAFLTYEEFEENSFPAILESCRVDFLTQKVKHRSFRTQANPPILHRKELLLAPDHPCQKQFSTLTNKLEELGLFKRSHTIGYKQQWYKKLEDAGVKIENHELHIDETGFSPDIQRHKTAMSRYQISKPMQLLVQHGFINAEKSVFDYGCGQGDDIDALQSEGIDAIGWDPHFASDTKFRKSHVVNLGYVLNVIENPNERSEALKRAWSCCDTILVVAVLPLSAGEFSNLRPYRDGYVTSRGTFQKYYSQEEAKKFISDITGEMPVPMASGIFFVFRDKLAEQSFLVSRQQRNLKRPVTFRPTRERKEPSLQPLKSETLRTELEELWKAMLDQGRSLHSDELSTSLRTRFKGARVSLNRAEHICRNELFNFEDLEKSRAERREDLLVYFALTLFSGRKNYTELPQILQRDVKAFFGSHANALLEARELLFTAGNDALVRNASEEAVDEGYGYFISDTAFQFHSSALEKLPAVLRVFVGCGETLYGDISGADLFKIHIGSKKLTLHFYDDFSLPLPELKQRVKINMQSQSVKNFDYRNGKRQYLFMKSLYMENEHPQFAEQSKFDRAIMKFDQFDFSFYGPDADYFDQTLSEKGLSVVGFELKRTISDVNT